MKDEYAWNECKLRTSPLSCVRHKELNVTRFVRYGSDDSGKYHIKKH